MSESLFDEGKRLMSAGKYVQACPKLEESYRLDPATGTLLNLASCHEQEGKTATAWAEYRDGIAAARKDGRPDRVAFATQRAEALESMLSRLTIQVRDAAQAESLELRLDGRPLGKGSLGTPISLDPGSHRVTAVAPRKLAWSIEIEIGAKADRREVVVPTLTDAPSVPDVADTTKSQLNPVEGTDVTGRPTAGSDRSGAWQRPTGFVVGGVGLIGLGIGTGFLLSRGSKLSDRDSICPSGLHCTETEAARINELTEEARTSDAIAKVGFVAGGALLVGGIVLALTAPHKQTRPLSSVSPRVWRDARGTWIGAGGVW